jgi:hypothetical protein
MFTGLQLPNGMADPENKQNIWLFTNFDAIECLSLMLYCHL